MKKLILAMGIGAVLFTSCGRDHTNSTASIRRVPDSKTTENITNNVGRTDGSRAGVSGSGYGAGMSYGSYNYGNEAAKGKQNNIKNENFPVADSSGLHVADPQSSRMRGRDNLNNGATSNYKMHSTQRRTKVKTIKDSSKD